MVELEKNILIFVIELFMIGFWKDGSILFKEGNDSVIHSLI